MFVFRKTYDNLMDRFLARGTDLNDSTTKLRNERRERQIAEASLKTERNRIIELDEKLTEGEKSWEKVKADISSLRETIKNGVTEAAELTTANRMLFARAGGFAQQFKSMQKRVMSASTLRELKTHVGKSLRRAELKEKRETEASES